MRSNLKQLREGIASTMARGEIHAMIGVWFKDGKTFYVRRSEKMQNYPNVWSLLSIRFEPTSFAHDTDLVVARDLMERMSRERLSGIGITVCRYLTSAHCFSNPTGSRVFLHMFEVELDDLPMLNPEYYSDFAWLTPEEYAARSVGASCGLCVRMWSDYSVRHGLTRQAFAPELVGAQ
jgi:hypothetical protein